MNNSIKNFIINEKKTIKDAFVKIDKNTLGIIFIVDKNNKVIGCATDGDIRTKLLKGFNLKDQISICMNRNFKYST